MHPALAWVQVQPTAVKEDSSFEVLDVSVTTNPSLDRHDLAIHSFGNFIRDFVCAKTDYVLESLFDRPSKSLHRLEVRTDHSFVPIIEVFYYGEFICLVPQIAKYFLVTPCLGRIQFMVIDFIEACLLCFRLVFETTETQILRTHKRRVTFCYPLSIFFFALCLLGRYASLVTQKPLGRRCMNLG